VSGNVTNEWSDKQSHNHGHGLAALIGGWSVRHRIVAIVGWLAFVLVASVVGSMVGQEEMTEDQYAEGDSATAIRILDEAGLRTPASEMVLVTSDGPITDRENQSAVAQLVADLRATPAVVEVTDPYLNGLVSPDGHSVLVRVDMTGDPLTAADRVQPIVDTVAAARADHPELRFDQFGDGSANQWFDDTIGRDFRRAEWTAVPLAIGILLVAFGAVLAAVLPVGLALTSFLAANGLLALVSQGLNLDASTSSVMLLVGLAVGVDYCMFYLRRVREERVRGRDPATALRIAAATSGRSVLVSGLTVVVAMSGMFLSGMLLFDGFAIAAILVVLVAVIGSVTVLPAVLSLLGDRIELGKIPGLGRMRRPGGESKVWSGILRPVLRRPAVSATLATGTLLVLAAPVTGIHTENLSLDKLLPEEASIMQSYHHITEAFPGGPAPAVVVVKAPVDRADDVAAAVEEFRVQALATGLVEEPVAVESDPPSGVVQISVRLAGSGSDETSVRALQTLREDVVPDTVGSVPGAEAYVAGNLAFSEDFNAQLQHAIAPVIVFVMVLAFLLMLLAFRSVPIALVSVLLNLLSMAATFGVMVAVFQHGWGADLVGGGDVGAIQSWIPLFAFVILFGLSMDYHVFVVSRIQEGHDRGLPTRDAVAHGIKISAGVVTSAAVIMVAVFSVFATLSMTTFKQLGVGLAVAILLDATVVRAVLLPSVLTCLGERTWWLPRWLSFLPGGAATPPESATLPEPATKETERLTHA
jgi:RND superfamily putative drug exporter